MTWDGRECCSIERLALFRDWELVLTVRRSRLVLGILSSVSAISTENIIPAGLSTQRNISKFDFPWMNISSNTRKIISSDLDKKFLIAAICFLLLHYRKSYNGVLLRELRLAIHTKCYFDFDSMILKCRCFSAQRFLSAEPEMTSGVVPQAWSWYSANNVEKRDARSKQKDWIISVELKVRI